MRTEARGGARARGERFYAHVRYGRSRRLELRVPFARSQDEADARAAILATAATAFVKVGRRDLVPRWLRELAEASTDAQVAKVQKAIDKIVRGERQLSLTGDVLFEEWARRWTSGELAAAYPDHVKAKDHGDDASRLKKYITKHVGDVPVAAFTLAHAERVMTRLPAKLSPATRRHVAQIMSRLMHLAVYPGQLIAVSPIPRGWLPKVKKSRHYSCLFPREEALLLAHAETPAAFRLFCGVLNREGMRLSELLDSEWWQWGDDCRTFTTTKTKTGDPRMWAVRADVARAMLAWRDRTPGKPFAAVAEMGDRSHIAQHFREALRAAGVTRPELFESTEHTRKLRAHDMRATFVTLSLAEGREETWIRDRTGHKSTAMVDRYRRHARQLAELEVGRLVDLDVALGLRRIPSTTLGGGGKLVEDPSKTDPSKRAQPAESTEGGTRTLTTRGRRILNPPRGSEGGPEVQEIPRKTTSRDVSGRSSTTLPPPPRAPAATSAADSPLEDEGSTAPSMGCRLEVDGELVAAAREGAPADVAEDLAHELRRAGAAAVAHGEGVLVAALPPPAKARARAPRPERRRAGGRS